MTRGRAPHPRRRRWLILLLEALVLILAIVGIRAWTQRDLATGQAPAFESQTLGGTPVSLADYRGEPLLVHFWATWCRVCRLEQDTIQAISRDWPVLTVALSSGDAASVGRYLSERQLSWTTIVDEHGELARLFGVRGVPTSFILGPDGEIRFREVGFTTNWGLRARLWFARH